MAIMLPRQQTWGESLASGLGAGLGSGLQALANMKLKEMEQDRLIQQLGPIYEQYNLPRQAVLMPGQTQAQLLKPFVEQEQMKRWASQLGMGAAPMQQLSREGAPEELLGMQPSRGLADLSATELASAMAIAPEKQRRALEPILNIKKGEEKLGSQRAFDYEKSMTKTLNNVEKFMTAADEALDFVKEHPDLFGPGERLYPSAFDSERQERDAIIDTLVKLGISLEGAIGRGSNMALGLAKTSKAAATFAPKEFVSHINRLKNIYGLPKKEWEDYLKMTKEGKPPKNFLSLLNERSTKRYKAHGANEITDQGPINLNELVGTSNIEINDLKDIEKILGRPVKDGESFLINNEIFDVGEK